MHDYTYYNWDSVKSILNQEEISFSDLASITGINHQYFIDSLDTLEGMNVECEEINPIHEVSDGSGIRTYTSTDYTVSAEKVPEVLILVMGNVSNQIDRLSRYVQIIHKINREE